MAIFGSGPGLLAALDVANRIGGGVICESHYDAADDAITLRHTQDVQPILDHNRELAAFTDGYTPSRLMRHAARIPNVLVIQWLFENGPDMEMGFNCLRTNKRYPTKQDVHRELARRLNDPQYEYVRTCPGRV